MHCKRLLAGVAALFLIVSAASAESERQIATRFMGLLRQRLLLSRQVAMAKFNSGAPVEDLKREKALIDQTVKKAGAEHEFARRILRAQIEASKVAQRRFLAKWAGHPRFAHAPNLASDIRPKLDVVTSEIVAMLRDVLGTSPKALRQAASRVIWPRQDRDCYVPAWKVSIDPAIGD